LPQQASRSGCGGGCGIGSGSKASDGIIAWIFPRFWRVPAQRGLWGERTTRAVNGDLPGLGSKAAVERAWKNMDARMRVAAQRLDDLRGSPTIEACHAAAVLAGVSLVDADECDDGACCCPRCPWKRTAANWRGRPIQASATSLRDLP
jgi:hypothetical protein